MENYKCEYQNGANFTKKYNKEGYWWRKEIEAENSQQAYERFLEEVGVYPLTVIVDSGAVFNAVSSFSDHSYSSEVKAAAGEHPQERVGKENANLNQPNIGAQTQDSDIEYQESGWAAFLNFCGLLNLILFVGGGIWLLDARSSDQFAAMNLTIIGLVAAINCFFFSFLVNTFTKIQSNTHQTTILLSKLIDKTETKDKT